MVCEASPDATSAGVDCPDSDSRVPGTTTSVYNDDSEVTSETDPDGNTTDYEYDSDGNQTEVTDPLENVTMTTYDADDRVSTVTQGYGSGSASTTTYTYDIIPDDCPSDTYGTTYCAQTENGLSETTTSYYNSVNELIEQDPPNTSDETPTTYIYDTAGNVLQASSGAGTATYSYDNDNRLTKVVYSDTPSGMSTPHSVTYSYNPDGTLHQMTDGTGTTTYEYDGLGRLTSMEDGAGNTVGYEYYLDGNVESISYPNDESVNYDYDGAGELTQMSDWLDDGSTSFSYDPDGNLTNTILPSGTTTIVGDSYDIDNALTDTSVNTAGTITELGSLTRNADDLIASTTPSPDDTTTYGYNPLNQVTTGLGAAYTYDAAGELTSTTPEDDSATDYSYNSDDQLCWSASTSGSCGSTPTGRTTFSYDVAGDRVSSTPSGGHPTTYGYDQAGDLVCETAANASSYSCASPNSSVTSTYSYDGNGLRMQANPAGYSSEQFTWNTASSVPQLLEDGNNYYLYGPSVGSAPLEQISIEGSTPSYLVSDTTGVREQLDSSGTVFGHMNYTSYGVPCDSCSISTPFGFEGGYTDATGLVYLIDRYYDPATGQFLTVDPDVDETGQPYTYAGGDPANGSDPNGTCVSLFNVVCVGGGPVTSTLSLRFDPGAGINAAVNIGRGASLGLTDRIVDISDPGASSTVPYNSVDENLGSLGLTCLVGCEFGGADTGGAAAEGVTDRVVIGKMADITAEGALGPGERTLLDQLPRLSTEGEQWAQNERVLLQEMKSGNPIRDLTVDEFGNPVNNTGYLFWERATLLREGWTYGPGTQLWSPEG
jgi:RHS repeat-associated protein